MEDDYSPHRYVILNLYVENPAAVVVVVQSLL